MCAADVSSVKVALFILTAVTSSFAGVISSIRTSAAKSKQRIGL
jgi:ribose/xylose/arabinose/galactoside ABC-type transport system permease subunit